MARTVARVPARVAGQAAVESRHAASRSAEVLAAHHDDATGELFGITELVRGVRHLARAIRFYEDKGLLSPRRINGARVYTRRDRARLALILRAKAIGVVAGRDQALPRPLRRRTARAACSS